MSSTLSTTQMVARLKRKTGLGLGDNDCMDFLNEAFRRIDQFSKGGFVWQIYTGTVTQPAGVPSSVILPASFDPGKTAWLRYQSAGGPTRTIIPYKPYKEFYNQQHFGTVTIGSFACWTFKPAFAGFTYLWSMDLNPSEAFPLPNPVNFDFTYHRMMKDNFTIGPAIYFPTPDQFDSLIMDLAEAEIMRIYGKTGWEKIEGQARSAVAEIIDTYRTERFDLAGLSDQVMQAQEAQAVKAR